MIFKLYLNELHNKWKICALDAFEICIIYANLLITQYIYSHIYNSQLISLAIANKETNTLLFYCCQKILFYDNIFSIIRDPYQFSEAL